MPNELPTITVVTPSFNQAEYLEQTIDSVLSQGYPRVEYVIMDGGSTDGSVEIIRRYEKYLHYWQAKADGGLYAAVNQGMAKSSGQICCYINSDDLLLPNAFAKVAWAFDSFPEVEWVVGKVALLDKSGRLNFIEDRAPYYSLPKFLGGQWYRPTAVPQDSTFWRRSLWEKVPGGIDTRFRLAGDFWLWTQFFRQAGLHFMDAFLGAYRVTGDNLAVTQKDRYAAECETIVREMREEGWQSNEPMPPPIEWRPSDVAAFARGSNIRLQGQCDNLAHRTWVDALVGRADWMVGAGYLSAVESIHREVDMLAAGGFSEGARFDPSRDSLAKQCGALAAARAAMASDPAWSLARYAEVEPAVRQSSEDLVAYSLMLAERGQPERAVVLFRERLRRCPHDREVVRAAISLLGRSADADTLIDSFLDVIPEDHSIALERRSRNAMRGSL
jgi:hypothetical protein